MLTEDLVNIRFAWTGSGTGDVVAGTAAVGSRTPPQALDEELVGYEIAQFDGSGALSNREIGEATWDHETQTLRRATGTVIYPTGGAVSFDGTGTQIVSFVAIPKTRRVASVADLQAVLPTEGALVFVEGYTTPGDGGGGLFRADLTGALQTDGGLVFGCTADESVEQSDTGVASTQFASGIYTPATNLVYGSVSVESEDGLATIVFTDEMMHGHRFASTVVVTPLVNHKTGVFNDPLNGIASYLNTRTPTTATVKYKTLGNARRWTRVWDGRVIDARWFGAVEGAEARDQICWALSVAKRVGASEVRLNGSYRYRYPLEVPDGVMFGWGKLTVIDEDLVSDPKVGPMLEVHNSYGTWYPQGEARKYLSGGSTPNVFSEHNAASWGLVDLELDGNYANVSDYYTTPANYSNADGGAGIESALQNTTIYGGINFSVHGGHGVPDNQRVEFRNLKVHGFGSNCILGYNQAYVLGENVEVGNSVRNHVLYHVFGELRGLRVFGFAWGTYIKTEAGAYQGCLFEDLTEVPTSSWTSAVELVLYEGWSRPSGGGAEPDPGRHLRNRLVLRDVWVDLAGVDSLVLLSGPLFRFGGYEMALENVTVRGSDTSGVSGGVRLVGESIIAGGEDYKEGITVRNAVLYTRGYPLSLFGEVEMYANVRVENVTIIPESSYEGTAATRQPTAEVRTPGQIDAVSGGPHVTSGRQMVFENIRSYEAQGHILRTDVTAAGAPPVEVTFRNCLWDGLTETGHYKVADGTGTLAGLTVQEPDKIRVSMEGCQANYFPVLATWNFTEAFLAMTALRECSDFNGRRSEVEYLYTATGGETQVDIQPGLLWAPKEFSCDGPVAWTSFEIRNSANAAALTSSTNEDKRNPYIRINFGAALTVGQRYVIRAAMGRRGTHHLLSGVAPAGGGGAVDSVFTRTGAVVAQAGDYDDDQVSAAASATNYTPAAATVAGHLSGIDTALATAGGGISALGASEVELTASATLTDAAHGDQEISGSTLNRRRVMINGAGSTTVALTVNASLTVPVKLVVDALHSGTAAIHLIPSGITWGDGSSTNPLLMINNPAAIVILEPMGNGRVKVLGDVRRRIDLGSNPISNNRERVYNSLSGAQTLSPTNFQEGSVLINIGPAATYTLPSRMTGAGDAESDSLELINEHATDALTLTASGVTQKGATSLPAGESAVARWFNRSGTEYVVVRASG